MSTTSRLTLIVKRKAYDEATWKRLLMAYAAVLYDRQRNQAPASAVPAAEAGGE